ncbi:23S rRNA (uracil(1939)-C(5))-methyltransferase RlmD [Anaerosacchariphilus polymeriproducens]|uniref:23S rRNA (Uracil(1939)-C(5))-methyltransferase RlmD n=1 Tax=Anaerosacchariphilus polymeriproducens TaxID=1812858 RepID=A0A371AVY6_9FIRM|nr:23S rRNA (uracil(1939)-C(5))-methyltransferase RlmD [Anaerosacchariphilus polymeriproducens]RDU23736.1 23S rRNA (uracil(1939)-C(5))-methyltransferase RlmD [Anaerosacchariphilus polymeriproducens]
MKKGQIYDGIIEKIIFPNKGIITIEEEVTNPDQKTDGKEIIKKIHKIVVKNGIPGQKVRFSVNKIRKGNAQGRLLEVLEKSPIELDEVPCQHFGQCGGCTYQNLSYEEQLRLKENQVKELLDQVLMNDTGTQAYLFEGIKGSPKQFAYRNKMEFSFGDEIKDGPLALGMHKRGSFHDIVTVSDCQIVDQDYRKILNCVLEFFKERNIDFYHKMQHIGYLRHLLVRRGEKTGEILVVLVTTTQETIDLSELVDTLLRLSLNGEIVGILNTLNDSLADVVQSDKTNLLYGQDYFYEELLGLKFKISPFSFFQTNSSGAELLYETARDYVGNLSDSASEPDKVIFDLYSGTGTIAQILAPVARKVVGVEIVEEAVEAAKENAKLNGLHNCEFIAGDVLKVIDSIEDKPDFIVLDPPRDGIHPKALEKIIDFGVDKMVYISCKPTSLVRDLEVLLSRGYWVEKAVAVDMFPGTVHVETVCLMERKAQ